MKPIKLTFRAIGQTKTCYKFETGDRPDQMTLYLKKSVVDAAGIAADKGVTVTVEGAGEE